MWAKITGKEVNFQAARDSKEQEGMAGNLYCDAHPFPHFGDEAPSVGVYACIG